MDISARIFVAGHSGFVGTALTSALRQKGWKNIILADRQKCDLTSSSEVAKLFSDSRPEFVIIAAGKVGGIQANIENSADLLAENILSGTNVIRAAAAHGVRRLLYLGCACVYPRGDARTTRIHEHELLSGPFEPTNEAYALAKVSGIKLCEYFARQHAKRFFAAIVSNLYGPHDNFSPVSSHVIPSLLRRFHEAKQAGAREVSVWGTGRAVRDLLFVDDAATALLLLLESYDEQAPINVGTGQGVSLHNLAEAVREVVGFQGALRFDPSRPDGMPFKVLDTSRIEKLGWKPRTTLREGLERTYRWALSSGAF